MSISEHANLATFTAPEPRRSRLRRLAFPLRLARARLARREPAGNLAALVVRDLGRGASVACQRRFTSRPATSAIARL
jgi:hypothetical protein